MNYLSLKRAISVIVLTFIFALGAVPASSAQDIGAEALSAEQLQQSALAQIATTHNVPLDNLEVGDWVMKDFENAGITLYYLKAFDNRDGETYALALDSQGNVQDWEATKAADAKAYTDIYGKLHPDLYNLLQNKQATDVLEVAIWLTSDVKSLPLPTSEHELVQILDSIEGDGTDFDVSPITTFSDNIEQPDVAMQPRQYENYRDAVVAYRAANSDFVASQIADIQKDILGDLALQGAIPTYVSPATPLIYVELSVETILSYAERADVDTMYATNIYEYADTMDNARVTHKANIVESTFGYNGTGVEVAILEDSRIEFNNPWLNLGGTDINDTVRVPGDANVDQHATATGGMVASTNGTVRGISADADLYSANGTSYSDANMSAAIDWASATKNVDIVNNSWGGNAGNTDLNVHDRHVDYMVRVYRESFVIAAGNNGGSCGAANDRVGSPGRAYNAITVGNMNDAGTLGWGDDSMSVCSSFIDPSTGVEKPEVSASGTTIESTTDNPADWLANVGSGTSYASPMVSGEAALLIERDPNLSLYPEVVKSTIMATALHNVEGASRLSEVDGAGAVDMRAAFHLVDEGWWSTTNVVADFVYTETQYIHAGERVRAVIAWESNPNGTYTTDPLEADIDMRVYRPDGTFLTGSSSINNNFEIVDFTAPSSGTYSFRIYEYTFSGTSERVGFSVWPGQQELTPYIYQGEDTPPASRDYHHINASQSGWHAVGVRPPDTNNYNIYLYEDTAFGDPDDYNLLEDSTLGAVVDFVVIDRHHAPSQDYFTEVNAPTGTGNYIVEWAPNTGDIYAGETETAFMNTGDVVFTWDAWLPANTTTYYKLETTSGSLDLGMALFASNIFNSASFYQGRSQAVKISDTDGAGGEESFVHTTSLSDWHGLVVWSKSGDAGSNFQIHACNAPTPPDLSISLGMLDWTTGHDSSVYPITWSFTDPYFNPGDPGTLSVAVSGSSSAANTSTIIYYVIQEENPCDLTSTISNRVGAFEYDIVPGS